VYANKGLTTIWCVRAIIYLTQWEGYNMSCACAVLPDYHEGASNEKFISQPWDENPYVLTNWWEMIEFSARRFFWVATRLQQIKLQCYVSSIPGDGNEAIFALPHDLDVDTRVKAADSLSSIAEIFHGLGMQISAETVREVEIEARRVSRTRNFQWLIDQVETIRNLAEKEMKGKGFFYVGAERAKFFPRRDEPHLFGERVANEFPSATYEIAEAGTCLALARGSACVFHLMRVLEIGLTALGKKFGVSMEHTNWKPAIDEIESKIRDMPNDPAWRNVPDRREQQEFYAQASSHFVILKDAWRNYTMHKRGVFTEEQAERVFQNTKAFMQKLTERLSE
jgi:hypothetical protein